MTENTLITYDQALTILRQYKGVFSSVSKPLEACTGAYLAEDLFADRAFPPFDRVTMDGIAIAFDTFENGKRVFLVEDIAPAGMAQKTLKDTQNCIEVMTGAIMPNGVDTVIRYEDIEIENGWATIHLDTLNFKQNVHFKGIDIAKDARIVQKGKQLSSAEINIAAAIGKDTLKVVQFPKAVIISTGDELVPVSETPELHQIRRSNIYGIKNTLQEWGMVSDLEHLPDDKAQMLKIIGRLLENYELLIFTGGVSKGKFDYLPEVLEELNVKKHFHKIQQRPGKPFWFGTTDAGNKIFALPGNPVSSFVCVYLYLHYWLKQSMGLEMEMLTVKLGTNITFNPDLIYFLEAKLESQKDGSLMAMPELGNGSGDFANLVKTDGFLILPQNKSQFFANEVYPFVPYRRKW